VFHAVRRILRDDGTLWLNLGDSYASQGGDAGGKSRELDHLDGVQTRMRVVPKGSGLKPKDLCGIPWRVALALQADGWYLRQDIIWHKPNPMPESVGDRCTKSHEYLFLLAKSERYYWDAEAMLDPASSNPVSAARRTRADYCTVGTGALKGTAFGQSGKGENAKYKSGTRNRRSVWTVATKPYKGAHFATFPLALIEPCILAGCPAGGVVLDPFMGSGTTAIVAQRNGRRSIGCELSGEYLNLAVKRFSQRMLIQPEDLMERDCDDAGV
jgi:DNA modification methylase